ncbi:hypothetical protein A3C26_02370 [Candidatus Daviesbacteria bacterium RIFCSPHIGHO2_02_FULL_39_12]|uniref:Carbonic anhydrase n=2 Tax=Candidatus Daviesiibacteriota TaxID=1752718 RepID=A0A1F5JA73_9BACT|nr:MAG: hypothetical protein A3C26_02370 [Candidatus Daviesbacteria bacterium RIFCSPHIGHO2_02_FULL_39_12]OGE71702.1 MAG: hypothetical protein A3H40_01680 [Candidatus Daviesbacteria bacterium RIFCSPLOWO2_02_FULL_38_15]
MDHKAEAVVVTCIDFRLQEIINKWISKYLQPKTYDRVAWAGGVKNLDQILEQVEISQRLHHIKKVVLINHEDCGAYGQEDTAQKHAEDLTSAKTKIQEQFPNLETETYYLHLDGAFESL